MISGFSICPEHYIQPAEVKMQFGIRQTVVVYNVLNGNQILVSSHEVGEMDISIHAAVQRLQTSFFIS